VSFMRPSTAAILIGILLMIVAFVAWMIDADDEPHKAPGSHRSSTKR
jgi:hypothetical protein